MRPQIKVCGLTDPADARAAGEAGAAFGGMVLSPVGPRALGAAEAGPVAAAMEMHRVGVFVDPALDELVRCVAQAKLDVVQLHGSEHPDLAREVRASCGTAVWKAIRVRDRGAIEGVLTRYEGVVDGILFDAYDPARPGGTGETFQWDLLAAVREWIPDDVRVILAGGLTPENVAAAIQRTRPDIVDVSSGVEAAPGRKSRERMNAFRAAVERASRAEKS